MENANEKREITSPSSPIIFKTPNISVVVRKKNKHKKKKSKSKQKNPQHSVKKANFKAKHKLCNMGTFEEAYSNAASWQLKHQIAYWKAKAKALEFENRVLHDIIRKNHTSGSSTSSNISDVTTDPSSDSQSESDQEIAELLSPEEECGRQDPDLEVSEEFLDFLTRNAKYKEDARIEREKLRAAENIELEEDDVKRMEAPPSNGTEEYTRDLKELYGNCWQRISALETSLQCKFMSDCDKYRPDYWPNIPFNFS